MLREKIKTLSLYVIGFIAVLFVLWLTLKFALPILLPFILAYTISYALRFGAKKLGKLTAMNEKILMASLLFLGVSALSMFIWFGASAFFREFRRALDSFSGTIGGNDIGDKINSVALTIGDRLGFGDEIEKAVATFLTESSTKITDYLATMATDTISALPSVALSITVGTISLFYFTFGYEKTAKALISAVPEKHRETIVGYTGSAMRGLGKFAKAYITLIAITFAELLLGFLILKIDHAFVFALFISIVDILPILGVGTILAPWALGCLIAGNTVRALGLVIIFAVVTLVRQPVEARLIGRGAGVHPIIALMAVYTGYRLAGFIGMIVMPTALTALSVIGEKKTKGVF